MKLDADEKELLESVERGEWKSAKGGKRERARYSRFAKALTHAPQVASAARLGARSPGFFHIESG